MILNIEIYEINWNRKKRNSVELIPFYVKTKQAKKLSKARKLSKV